MTAQLPLSTLRAMHMGFRKKTTQPRMALLTGGPLFPDNQLPMRFSDLDTGIVIRDRAAEFREEVEQILNEITLDEWTHPALDKIEDALLKGEE